MPSGKARVYEPVCLTYGSRSEGLRHMPMHWNKLGSLKGVGDDREFLHQCKDFIKSLRVDFPPYGSLRNQGFFLNIMEVSKLIAIL